MTQQIHHIKQKVFDVSFVNEPEGLNFQKRFSDFIKNELTAVTEKCLAEFDSPKVQMINRLELNLGTIPYEKYESVFLKTYEEIFTKELRNKLFVEGPDNEEDPDAGESLVGLIKHFLIKGYMPWNYSNEKWNSFSDLFDQVLSNEPQLLLDQIDCILESQSIRFRLIQQLEDDSIIKFVRQVEPTQSETIISFHHNWMRVQKRKKVFPDNVSLLSTTFWEIIFNYLYEDRGSYFNKKSFLISTLHQIAAKYNKSFSEIIGILKEAEVAIRRTINPELLSLIHELSEESTTKSGAKTSSVHEISPKIFNYYLKHNKWPEKSGLDASFDQIWNFYLQDKPSDLLAFIVNLNGDYKTVSRLIELLDDKGYQQIIRVADSSNADTIFEYESNLIIGKKQSDNLSASDEDFCHAVRIITIGLTLSNRSGFFNHKSFISNLTRDLASHFNWSYHSFLKQLRAGLDLGLSDILPGTALAILIDIIDDELNQETDHKEELYTLDSFDEDILEESIISGVMHPFLKKLGYHTLHDLLNYLKAKDPDRFNSFISDRLRRERFLKQLIKSIDRVDFFTGLIHSEVWKECITMLNANAFPNQYKLGDHRKAIGAFVLKSAFGLIDAKQVEREIMSLAKMYALDFNKLLKSLLWIAEKVNLPSLNEAIKSTARKFKLSIENTDIASKELEISEELKIQMELIQSGLLGIVNQQSLLKMGFKSIDELVRHLMKFNRAILRKALQSIDYESKPLIGIGRDISLSTYYSLLKVLNESFGNQLAHLLRTLELKLGEDSQMMNRFMSGLRMITLSQVVFTFRLDDFIGAFADLILDASPSVYAKLIPSLSNKMSNINVPTGRKLDDFITDLEKQLSDSSVIGEPMDRSGLQRLIRSEFFNEVLENESSIIPYFDETSPAIYDEIYIENAGLVLLSSYFPALFEKFSLIEEGKFLSQEKQESAVLLLQYLMLQEPPLNEHHIPLNKILCGIEVDTPIRTDMKLSDNNRQLVNGLIETVIEYWSAIGKSSVEGFQGSWLWRKGKLEHKKECWELKVEQHSYDMLLDRYPFTISPIKFSWMNKPLNVEWR